MYGDEMSSYVRMGALSRDHITQWTMRFQQVGGQVMVGLAEEDAQLDGALRDLVSDESN